MMVTFLKVSPKTDRDLRSTAETAVSLLAEKHRQTALAESCTGGLTAKLITDIPGSSDVFECGIVSYSCAVKERLLGVSRKTIEDCTVVSAEVAVEMADGVRKVGEADIGIGITGVAGPGPDGIHPEGEIFIALSDGSNAYVVHLQETAGGREQNRERAALQALTLLTEYLQDRLGGRPNG